MKLNCVSNDSSIQRMIIAKLVNNHPNLHLIGDFRMQLKPKAVCLYTIWLIFLDIEMPVISGFDFLDGLKQNSNHFITSKGRVCNESVWLRCHWLSTKPIAIDRFNASVKRAIELYQLKSDTKEEEGEHIFKVIWKTKNIYF
jgi:CheY-like chemotaxis protein